MLKKYWLFSVCKRKIKSTLHFLQSESENSNNNRQLNVENKICMRGLYSAQNLRRNVTVMAVPVVSKINEHFYHLFSTDIKIYIKQGKKDSVHFCGSSDDKLIHSIYWMRGSWREHSAHVPKFSLTSFSKICILE